MKLDLLKIALEEELELRELVLRTLLTLNSLRSKEPALREPVYLRPRVNLTLNTIHKTHTW